MNNFVADLGRLRVFQFSAKLNLMEYRGIRYTIRAGIERGQYRVVIHPDGDEMYAFCNIGALSRAPDRSFVWKFRSYFPGTYLVEIVFYDIRGGYDQAEFIVEVKPWWS